MKWNCEIIQDLLPLYEEGLCRDASAQAVREHLAECESCRKLTGALPFETPEELPKADQAVAKSMKKVKRRWLTSLVAAVLVVPLLLMFFNQFRGSGLCFTNIDDILTARRFLTALEKQDWEKAAAMHDYSGDYESITEALELGISDWGTSFTPITLEGEPWMLKTYLAQGDDIPETVNELFSFLYNQRGTAMLPPELWERVRSVDPEAISEMDGWRYDINGELYAGASTQWGNFITPGGRKYADAAEYCTYIDLVPAFVYEEAKADLEAEAQRLYTSTHAAYDYVADMTQEEFLQYMAQSYAADLKELEDVVTFDYTGYQGAYLLWENDGWHVQFGVTLTYQGNSLDTTIAIGVEAGKVRIVSLSHREQTEWLDELEKVLYPSAHPDY